jgi:hypothetical protein
MDQFVDIVLIAIAVGFVLYLLAFIWACFKWPAIQAQHDQEFAQYQADSRAKAEDLKRRLKDING